jgi:hypothetical protein
LYRYAESLSTMTTHEELAEGKLFPDFNSIQEVSADLTAKVCGLMVGLYTLNP